MTGFRVVRLGIASILAAVAIGCCPTPAAAQETRDVTIEFVVGDFDATEGDWPITAVDVSGDLDVGEEFVVELRDGDGDVLWSGSDEYTAPQTTVDVDRFVAVGDVEEAAIGQREAPPITAPPVEPTVPVPPAVEGDVVTNPPRVPQDDPSVSYPEDPEDPEDLPDAERPGEPPPDVQGDVVTSGEVQQQGSGLGGAGQLALSMVIAVVFVAILFRAPLPSATTSRWRK